MDFGEPILASSREELTNSFRTHAKVFAAPLTRTITLTDCQTVDYITNNLDDLFITIPSEWNELIIVQLLLVWPEGPFDRPTMCKICY